MKTYLKTLSPRYRFALMYKWGADSQISRDSSKLNCASVSEHIVTS